MLGACVAKDCCFTQPEGSKQGPCGFKAEGGSGLLEFEAQSLNFLQFLHCLSLIPERSSKRRLVPAGHILTLSLSLPLSLSSPLPLLSCRIPWLKVSTSIFLSPVLKKTDLFHCIILYFLLHCAALLNFLRCFLALIFFSLSSGSPPFFSYLSHLPITLRSLISTSARLFPSLFPYHHPSHITPNSLML